MFVNKYGPSRTFFFVVVAVRPDIGEGFLNSSHFVAVKGERLYLNKNFMFLMISRIFVKPKQTLPGLHCTAHMLKIREVSFLSHICT